MRQSTQANAKILLALMMLISLPRLALAQSFAWPANNGPANDGPTNNGPSGNPPQNRPGDQAIQTAWPSNTAPSPPPVSQAPANFQNSADMAPRSNRPFQAAELPSVANQMQPAAAALPSGIFSAEPMERRPIYVGLPLPQTNATGEVTLVPNLQRRPPTGMEPPLPASSGANGPIANVNPLNAPPGPAPANKPLPAELANLPRDANPSRGTRALPTAFEIPPPRAEVPAPPGMMIETLPNPPGVVTQPGGVPLNSVVPESLGQPLGREPFVPGDGLCPEDEIRSPIWDDLCNITGHLFRHPPICADGEAGIGHERVMLAPLEIECTQPMSDLRLRFDAGYNVNRPDRDEYFWAKSRSRPAGRGPAQLERNVDYQEFRVISEVGGKSFSATTEYPIRLLAPEVNDNTNGFGDMQVATKILLMDGARWQIAQVFRTTINTGSSMKGLGTGHVSLEPGFLFRYKWSPETYIHSELKYWIPLAGSDYAGQIIRASIGVSHVWYESDSFAILPTLEFVGLYPQDGYETDPATGLRVSADSSTVINACPGARIEWDTGGDLGLIEIGIGSEFALTNAHWPSTLLRFELRYNF